MAISDLSVTDGKTSVVPGLSYSNFGAPNNDYTVTVTNNGPDTVTQFTLNSGVLPQGFNNPSSNGSVGTIQYQGNNNFLWSGLSLASGQSAFDKFIYRIDPSATGTIAFTLTVAAPAGTTDPDATNNSATDSDTATPQADLAVTMTDGKTSVVPGTSNTYTITVSNNGPSTVSSLTLTDTIPAALLNPTFGTPSVGTYDATTGVWSGLSLASGQNVSITLTGTVDPNLIGSLTNTVTVAAPSGVSDTNSANNTASDTDTPAQADLSVAVSDGKTSVVPGTSNPYTITVTNNGPSTVSSLTLTDTIPATLLNAIFGTPSVGTYDATTGVWSGLSLATGGSVSITLTGTIDPSTTSSLSNTVTVSAPSGTTDTNLVNNSATDNDTATPQADLSVTLTDGVSTVTPGTTNTYTITVTNNGPSTVTSLTLTDTIPAALLNASFGTPSVGTYDPATRVWSGLSLASGQNVTLTLTGTIDPSATSNLVTTATVSPPSGTTDTNATNDSATDTDTLTPFADLAVTMTGVGTVPGSSTTYTITVINNGPSTAAGALVTDFFPATLTNVVWTAVATAGSSVAAPTGTGNIADLVTLLPGGNVTFTAVGQIDPSLAGTLANNTATVTAPAGTTDPNVTDDSSTFSFAPTPQADIAVSIDDGTTTVVPGTSASYFINVTNNGPSTVSSLIVTDTLPAALLNPHFFLPSGFVAVGAGPSVFEFSLVNNLAPGRNCDPPDHRHDRSERDRHAHQPSHRGHGGDDRSQPHQQHRQRYRHAGTAERPGGHHHRRRHHSRAGRCRHLHHHGQQQRTEHGQQFHPDRHDPRRAVERDLRHPLGGEL
jgi:uncharacterized repeat protein (TIGR01451 family)